MAVQNDAPSELSKRAERDLLISAFETVRTRYFPRWDKAGVWKCRIDRRMAGDGLCCQARKTIYINVKSENLVAVLIHEICHALRPRVNHGGDWQRRMLMAAQSAKRLGELSLAELLRLEVTQYRDHAEVVTGGTIYTEIEEAVEESSGNSSFRSIVAVLAPKYLMNRREFVQRFPRSERVYKRADAAKRRRLDTAVS